MDNKENLEDVTTDTPKEVNLEKEDFSIEDKTIYCSNCGNKNPISNKFCSNCGNKLKSIENSIKEATNTIKTSIQNNKTYQDFTNVNNDDFIKADWDNKDIVDFIQKNVEYYIPKFKLIQDFNKTTSWNWAAFFLSSNWFFYRKMYGIGAGVLLLSIISTFIPFIGFPISIGILILSGLYGNILYLKHIQKQLDALTNINDDVRHRIILTNGGTNLWLPIVLCVLGSLGWTIVFFTMAMSSLFMYY